MTTLNLSSLSVKVTELYSCLCLLVLIGVAAILNWVDCKSHSVVKKHSEITFLELYFKSI